MVAAISTASKTSSHLPKTPSTPHHHRPPLSPSDKTHNNSNNANSNGNSSIPKKPLSKSISSRYLPSSSSSSSQSQYPTPSKPISLSAITTRTLSVSFQGPSFSLQTTKPKPTSHQKPKIIRHPISLTKSVDFSSEKKAPILAAVRVVAHSVLFDEKPKRTNFNGEDLYLASDSDSGSSSGNADVPLKRGISVPARFWPENFGPAKKSVNLMDTQVMPSLSSRTGSLIRPNSPSTGVTTGSSVKRVAPKVQGKINAPSVLSFAAEARKAKKGESRIEEAHLLRMLHNRHLQWRFMNAQANAAIFSDRVKAEVYAKFTY